MLSFWYLVVRFCYQYNAEYAFSNVLPALWKFNVTMPFTTNVMRQNWNIVAICRENFFNLELGLWNVLRSIRPDCCVCDSSVDTDGLHPTLLKFQNWKTTEKGLKFCWRNREKGEWDNGAGGEWNVTNDNDSTLVQCDEYIFGKTNFLSLSQKTCKLSKT